MRDGTRGVRLKWGYTAVGDSAGEGLCDIEGLDVRFDHVPSFGDYIVVTDGSKAGLHVVVQEVTHEVSPATQEQDPVHHVNVYVVPA